MLVLYMMSTQLFFILLAGIAAAECCTCPSGWRNYNGNCYFFGKSKLSWIDSRTACEDQNGHLASVTSEGEHDFIVQQIILEGTSHSWIGGSDIGKEGIWSWEVSGRKLSYSKWHPGQPHDNNSTKNCLLMNKHIKYNWDDYICTGRYSFVCEKEGNELHTHTRDCSSGCTCDGRSCCSVKKDEQKAGVPMRKLGK